MQRRFTQIRDGLKLTRAEGQPAKIAGYGAVFYRAGDRGTEYWLWSDMVERILPGCFDRAIREDDVRSLFNHDANLVLGRNRAGTLKLRTDERGLLYEATTPDTQLCRDQVVAPIDRGDVSGSSFMFTPRKTVWIEEQRDGQTVFIRELHDVQLWEVGPVVFPAYEGTTTGVREQGPAVREGLCLRSFGKDDATRQDLDAWRRSQSAEADRVDVQYRDFLRRERERA